MERDINELALILAQSGNLLNGAIGGTNTVSPKKNAKDVVANLLEQRDRIKELRDRRLRTLARSHDISEEEVSDDIDAAAEALSEFLLQHLRDEDARLTQDLRHEHDGIDLKG